MEIKITKITSISRYCKVRLYTQTVRLLYGPNPSWLRKLWVRFKAWYYLGK